MFQREAYDPTSHLIYYLSKQFPDEFMVSTACFKSSSIHHDVLLVNYGPILKSNRQ